MSRFGIEYRVARPTGVCASTGRRLEPGTACMAALMERAEDDGFERSDYALEAWDAEGPPPGVFSYWKTIVPDPDARRNMLVDDAVLMDLFEALAGDARRKRQAYRFILALILMRKRLLRYAGRTGTDEDERWLMKPRGAGPDQAPIEVVNPRLTDEDVRELTNQLGEVLQSEL